MITEKELQKIERKFKRVKKIHCLNLKKEVDVTNVPRLQYNADDDTITSPSRIICFWREGTFAEIIK